MPTHVAVKVMPVLLGSALVALACEKPPNVAPDLPSQRPTFAASNGKTDRITGGGKLGGGRDFATFGFNAREGQGQFQWVQHCLDGVTGSPTCLSGGFTFHGSTVTDYGFAVDADHCRAWSGEGEAKFKDLNTTSTGTFFAKACDFGEPGRGTDTMCFKLTTTDGVTYVRGDDASSSSILNGGNIQLHNGAPPPSATTCTGETPPV